MLGTLVKALAARSDTTDATGGQFVHPYSMGRPLIPEFDPGLAVREGYHLNAWLFACVALRARLVASLPWRVLERKGSKWQPIPGGHDLEHLLESPNNRMTRQQLFGMTSQHLDLSGNYIWKIVSLGSKPDELWPMNPAVMRPVVQAEGDPSTFRPILSKESRGAWTTHFERTDGVTKERVPVAEAVHGMCTTPDNPMWGSPPYRAVRPVVEMDRDQVQWNRSTVRNMAVPPGAIVDPQPMEQKEADDTKEALRERFSGPDKAREPMLLTGGATWVPFGMTPVEMDWLDGRKFNVVEICAVYNVPPQLILPDGSKYDNLKAAIPYLYEHSALPQADLIEGPLNLALFPKREDRRKYWIHYDTSGIEALQDNLKEDFETLGRAVENGIRLNDVIALLELPLEPQPGGDVPRYRSTLVEWTEEGTEEADAKLEVAAA
jgi:HK97 family phage portal protein